MEKEVNTKIILLDSTNRDNYMRMLDRKMGMQIILCSVADLQFKLRKEAEHEISGTSGSCREKK